MTDLDTTILTSIQQQEMPWLLYDKHSLTTSNKNIILKGTRYVNCNYVGSLYVHVRATYILIEIIGEMLTDKHMNFA